MIVDKVGAYTSGQHPDLARRRAGGLCRAHRVSGALRLASGVPRRGDDLIPTIGATLGAVICVLVALPTKPLWPNTVLVALFFVLYQQLENYVIAPRIMRKPIPAQARRRIAGQLDRRYRARIDRRTMMAIPVAAGVKVLMDERLQARDEADTHPTTPDDDEDDDERAPPPG